MSDPTIKVKASDHINDMSLEYARVTAEKRGIPKVADGLKDSQRKAIYVIRSKSDKIKTVSLSGEVIAQNLYVHGDVALSDAISTMAAPYKNNIPFMYGIGTFGTKVDPDAFAAPRYTYVKKNKGTELLLSDLDIIPMQENYDGSTMEPIHFLPIVPTVLLNGVSGIASGWSTDILPHSLSDIIDGCLKALDGKKIDDLVPHFDYQSCKINLLEKSADSTSWEFVGDVQKIDHSTVKVSELPPGKSLESFREHLSKLEDDGKIQSYTDSSTDQIDVQVKFKRGEVTGMTNDFLVNLLKLRVRATERLVCVDFDNISIRQFKDTPELINAFVDFRLQFYRKRFKTELDERENEHRYWSALNRCFEQKLVDKLRSIESKKDLVQLIKDIVQKNPDLKLTDDQINKIAELPTYRWTKEYHLECLQKIESLEARIKELTTILGSVNLQKDCYRSELKALKAMKFEVKR